MPIPPTTGLVQVDDRTGSTANRARRRPRSSSPRARAAAHADAAVRPSRASATSGPRRWHRLSRVSAGGWRLGNQIGEGSYSTVFIGMCKATGQLIAIKRVRVPSSEAKIAELKNEVEIMRELVHQNIVRYLGVERVADSVYVLEEWVPGGSVASLVEQFGPLPDSVTREYSVQALRGLVYLHSHDLIHRDVKGGNMLVTDDGILKLADFGSCKRLVHVPGQAENEDLSAHIGTTPYFMAPEIMARHPAEFKSDVWSLGGAALEMATGSPPWKGQNFAAPAQLFEHVKALVAETGSARASTRRRGFARGERHAPSLFRVGCQSEADRARAIADRALPLRLPTHDDAPARLPPRRIPRPRSLVRRRRRSSLGQRAATRRAERGGRHGGGDGAVPNLNATPVEAERTPPAAAGPSNRTSPRDPSSASSIADGGRRP